MKFSMKMAVLSMAGVLALGGAATAASFIFNDVTTEAETVAIDSALILNWNSENSNIGPVESLDNTVAQYRQLALDWSKSSSVNSGTITLTLTLTDNSQSISVDVATKPRGEGFVDSDVLGTLTTAGSEVDDSGNYVTSANFEVADLSTAVSSSAIYYLKISVSEAKNGSNINGNLVASLSCK